MPEPYYLRSTNPTAVRAIQDEVDHRIDSLIGKVPDLLEREFGHRHFDLPLWQTHTRMYFENLTPSMHSLEEGYRAIRWERSFTEKPHALVMRGANLPPVTLTPVPDGWRLYVTEMVVKPDKGSRKKDPAAAAAFEWLEAMNDRVPKHIRQILIDDFDLPAGSAFSGAIQDGFGVERLGDEVIVVYRPQLTGMRSNAGEWGGNAHWEPLPRSAYWALKEAQ